MTCQECYGYGCPDCWDTESDCESWDIEEVIEQRQQERHEREMSMPDPTMGSGYNEPPGWP